MKKMKTVKDNHLFFRKLIEHSHDGISLIDKNFYVIYQSPSSTRINGFEAINEQNNSIKALVHPEDIEEVLLLLQDLLLFPGKSVTNSFRSKHADGHFIWIKCTYTNRLHESEINAIVCNFKDISTQKHSEDLLQHSIQELSAYKYALDEAAIVAITDQKGIITHVNDNFCKISKYSREELIGQDHRIINSSFHSKAFIRNLWRTIANGKIWKEEMKNKAKDGSNYWVDTTIIPFLNKQGKPYQYVAIRSDITERKLAQEQIIENERFNKTITDHIPAMISYWNADLQCMFANKTFLNLLNKTPKQVLGNHKKNLMSHEDFLICEPHIQQVLAGKKQSFERSFHSNGKTIFTYSQYVPNIQHKKITGFYSLAYDYSDIRAAQLEVINKTAQIEDLLDNITDGFIALDQNRCYTYANKHIGKILGIDPTSLIGKNIWQLFPDAKETSTYNAIESAYVKREYICNEDYYAPLNLWQENRIYPSGNGLSIFIRDISDRKSKEIEKSILSFIRQIFSQDISLKEILIQTLNQFLSFGDYSIAEIWLIENDRKKISQVAKKENTNQPFVSNNDIKSFPKGKGLPGITWETKKSQFWTDIDQNEDFVRANSAKMNGLKSAHGIPLFYNSKIIGVLIFGLATNEKQLNDFTSAFDSIGSQLGLEIKRKQLEQELNQVFNFTPDILCICNVDGYFKKVNPAMSTILGFSEEELLSRPFVDFIHPSDKAKTTLEIQDISYGKSSYYFENRYFTKSGKIKWLAWTATAAAEQGMLYCSAKDITEKKELRKLLDNATNLARIGGWEIDLIQNTIYWSEMTHKIHETAPGFEPDFESGISFYKEGINREKIISKLEQVIKTGAVCDEELQIVTAKGNLKWIRVIAEAEFAKQKCIRVYGSFQDIDALKKSEIIAKEILEERNTILESIGDAFFAIDKNWMVTYWNNTAEKVLQKTKVEVLNQYLWDIFPELVNTQSHKKYHQAIAKNQAIHFEDYYLHLNKWNEISAYPANGGLSVYFKDITQRKTSELQLKELNITLQKHSKELAISNAELEQFAYVASHDLQEPLRMITSFLTQLELKYGNIVDDRGRKYIHFAVDGAKRMRQIILDLLAFSRIGRNEAQPEEVNISDLINDILVLFHKKIEEQHAKIIINEMPILLSYKAPLRQLFQNLISNALKYKHQNRAPEITLSCQETTEHYLFSIKDNGIGISNAYFEKIFIIFQRLHNKDEYEGTGMGLAITKKIVENIGGKIWVESIEGEGSTFHFLLLKTI